MHKKTSANSDNVPNPFVQKHQADVIGILRGFDRLRLALLRGLEGVTLRNPLEINAAASKVGTTTR